MERIREMKSFYKKELKSFFVPVLLTLIALLGFFIVYFKNNPALAINILAEFSEKIQSMSKSGGLNYFMLIMNNVIVGVIAVILGFIPFFYLSFILIITNAFVSGAVLSVFENLIKIILFGILPHGTFELPALALSVSCGLYLCNKITMRLLKKSDERISTSIYKVTSFFVLIILPMFILAGFIEIYLTPYIMKTFLLG